MLITNLKISFSFIILFVIIVLLLLNETFVTIRLKFNAYLTNSSLNQINKLTSQKNISLFCFIKTHPGNFENRLPKSYNNCIKYCTDYRYGFKKLKFFEKDIKNHQNRFDNTQILI